MQAVRAGAFDYISKPFNIDEVKATVQRALAEARRRPPTRPQRRCCSPKGCSAGRPAC